MNTVSLLSAEHVYFRLAPEALSRQDRERVSVWWENNKSRHPTAFNGPVLACHSLRSTSESSLEIEWCPTNYAHYLMRFDSICPVRPVRAIFSGVVLLTAEGTVAIGRMSSATSASGRLQLPGGIVEIPIGSGLSLAACANAARFELAEELGLKIAASQLQLWRVKVGGPFDDVGFLYASSLRLPEAEVAAIFEQRNRALENVGETPEFSNLYFWGSSDFSDKSRVDYLPDVMKEALRTLPRSR